jgi:DNA-binding MarR family transcriptional regulator
MACTNILFCCRVRGKQKAAASGSTETACEILMFIIEKKNPSQTETGEHSGISSTSVNWHIKRFEDAKIIDEIMEDRFKHYKLGGDCKLMIVATLKNFYSSV